MEMKLASQYNVLITHALNGGFVVEVGCARFAYTNSRQLCKDLKLYLDDPQAYEEKYREVTDKMRPQLHAGAGMAQPEACEPNTEPMEVPGPTPVEVETAGTPPGPQDDSGTDAAQEPGDER